jgi:DMSO/TMAO reductase YedYZ heme-binding membrane subunit
MRKIVAILIAATVVILFVLVATKAGRDIDAATQHFMLFYAGVLALVALTGSVMVGLLATDRVVMTPGHRVMAQAVHRAFSFGALAFLIIHIATEILAQRSHIIDAFIPFLSPYRTFYIGLGTIASDLIVLLVVTSILRKRFTAHGKAWRWRAIHYGSYVAFVFGVLHGLLGGRAAKPYVDWSYGLAIAVTALGLAVRFLAISLRPKENMGSSPSVDRARVPGSSPLHAAAMRMSQAQLGGTVQVLPAGLSARGAPIGDRGPDSWAALPAPSWSPSSGPLPALGPAPAYAGPPAPAYAGPPAPAYAGPSSSAYAGPSSSDAHRDLGFMPLGAPPYGDDVPSGLRGRPYLAADQPRSALRGSAATSPARPARQPLYEPGYDGPPRFEGAPRGHGDVPQDELSSYPYGPPGRRPPAAAPYPDDYTDRAGSGGHTGLRPGRPESARPRAAIAPPTQNPQNTQLPQSPRQAGRSSGPLPALGTGPMPQLGPGPMPRPDTGAMPRPDTGPIPRVGNGQVPRHSTGPMPRAGTGPMPRADSGPMPRLGPGPMPRPDTGPMPRPDTGPIPRVGNGQGPRRGTGPMPRAGTGPMPRADSGPMPRPDTGPIPRVGTGPLPRLDTGPIPRVGTGPLPRLDTGPIPRAGTGPLPRLGTGPVSRPGPGSSAWPETGPMPRPGQPGPPADLATGPRTGPLPEAAPRPSHRAKSNDPRYRDIPGPTGGGEWE